MEDWIPTTCMRCAVGCGHLQRGEEGGRDPDAVSGDGAHPVSEGLACQRGIEETANPVGERLTVPLIREDGVLREASWERALDYASDRFEAALSRNSDGVAVLGSGQQTNEATYALGKLARGGFGTRYYDANTTLCMASAVTAYYDAFGSDAPPPTYDDISEAERHVVWGANPAVAHPVMFQWIAESASDPDSKLVVVDPVETETAKRADLHVPLDLGDDLTLARAVLSHLLETDDVDREFVEEATTGFDALTSRIEESAVTPNEASVPSEAVAELAESLTRPTLVYWGMGVNQSVEGTETAGALIDLCLATGNLRPGTGPFSLTGQANSMGARVCSSKGTWPGHRPFGDERHRETVADAWDVPVSQLPDDAGPGPVGVVEAMDDGPVEACWTIATNPVAGLPDASTAAERLEDVFLVAQDAFRTPTTEVADVVLPAATWGHSEGTVINMERRVSRVRSVTDTSGGLPSDLDIIAAIAERVVPELLETPPCDPETVFDELRGLTEGTPADLSGITYERLDEDLAVRWPAPDESSEGGYRYYSEDDQTTWEFPTPSGKARFSTRYDAGVSASSGDDYPLSLTTARAPDGYNTGVRTNEEPVPSEPPVARIHPDTVAEHETRVRDGPSDGSHPRTVLESPEGSVLASVETDDAIPEGVVWLPIHHPEVNRLVVPATDPRSDEPDYKKCGVRLASPSDDGAMRRVRECA